MAYKSIVTGIRTQQKVEKWYTSYDFFCIFECTLISCTFVYHFDSWIIYNNSSILISFMLFVCIGPGSLLTVTSQYFVHICYPVQFSVFYSVEWFKHSLYTGSIINVWEPVVNTDLSFTIIGFHNKDPCESHIETQVFVSLWSIFIPTKIWEALL